MPFATAVELIHSYSLVHDDLPCMDDSPLRRGKPSVHAAFGEDMALLAGDALLTLAFEVMLRADNRQAIPAESVLAAAFTLAKRAGYAGMVGGQVIDLQSEGKAIGLPGPGEAAAGQNRRADDGRLRDGLPGRWGFRFQDGGRPRLWAEFRLVFSDR